jgi:O-methyltransferase
MSTGISVQAEPVAEHRDPRFAKDNQRLSNVFITQYFDWNQRRSWRARLLNRVLKIFRLLGRYVPAGATGAMTNVEQRMNMYHLLSQTLAFEVPGAVIELGSFVGSSAALFQKVIRQYDPSRELHVFDAFIEPSEQTLLDHFANLQLPPPAIHKGFFADTIPSQLPDEICFAHVDVGPGGSLEDHKQSLRLALEGIYPRLTKGGICLMQDYCVPDIYDQNGFSFPECIGTTAHWNLYPHVREITDEFLSDKPEKVIVVYSGELSHGYFRKAR